MLILSLTPSSRVAKRRLPQGFFAVFSQRLARAREGPKDMYSVIKSAGLVPKEFRTDADNIHAAPYTLTEISKS
jgi:hypothetical protein